MISYQEALSILLNNAQLRSGRHRIESAPIVESIGRFSAQNIYACESNPRFDNSAMDGYAIRSAETTGASKESPLAFKIVGCLAAGSEEYREPPEALSCIEIMTGARISDSLYDAVVRVEDAELLENVDGKPRKMLLRKPVEKGSNIRFAGEDVKSGELLFPRGTRIQAQHVLAMAMFGFSSVDLFAAPRVAILSTGSELAPLDAPALSQYNIRNSTGPLLSSFLTNYGATLVFSETVRDEQQEIRDAFLRAVECGPDLIISTGGVSVGKFDLVKSIVADLGARIHFHKAAVRPGKPVLAADFGERGPFLLGLPGNPIAVAVGIRFFILPYLRALFFGIAETPQRLPLKAHVEKPGGLTFFQRGVREGDGVRVLPGQASFMIRSFLEAEGWVVGPSESAQLETGDLVEWYPLWS